jgi:hypothetical protein
LRKNSCESKAPLNCRWRFQWFSILIAKSLSVWKLVLRVSLERNLAREAGDYEKDEV